MACGTCGQKNPWMNQPQPGSQNVVVVNQNPNKKVAIRGIITVPPKPVDPPSEIEKDQIQQNKE